MTFLCQTSGPNVENMIVNRFLWSFVVKNVSCRKYVPSKICPILLLVENMSTLLLVENMSVDNMSVENMSVEKTSRCLYINVNS